MVSIASAVSNPVGHNGRTKDFFPYLRAQLCASDSPEQVKGDAEKKITKSEVMCL